MSLWKQIAAILYFLPLRRSAGTVIRRLTLVLVLLVIALVVFIISLGIIATYFFLLLLQGV